MVNRRRKLTDLDGKWRTRFLRNEHPAEGENGICQILSFSVGRPLTENDGHVFCGITFVLTEKRSLSNSVVFCWPAADGI